VAVLAVPTEDEIGERVPHGGTVEDALASADCGHVNQDCRAGRALCAYAPPGALRCAQVVWGVWRSRRWPSGAPRTGAPPGQGGAPALRGGIREWPLCRLRSQRRLASLWDDIDTLLSTAEPFVDKDILRAHIMAKGDPPQGMRYGFAIVPGNDLLDPTRFYTCPLSSPHAFMVVVAVEPDLYAEFRKGVKQGFTRLFKTFEDHDTRLAQDRADPTNENRREHATRFRGSDVATRRRAIDAADLVFGYDTNTGVRSMLYGREIAEQIVKTGQAKHLGVIDFSLDFTSRDIDDLLADVVAVKGSHCYERGS